MKSRAEIQLSTLFLIDQEGRIRSTRETPPGQGPMFALIRRADSCAWAVGVGVGDNTARQLMRLAQEERPTLDFRSAPLYAEQYAALVDGKVEFGPAFEFPHQLERPPGTVVVEDINLILESFSGWTPDELPERSPILAVVENGRAVSVCFCARVSESAAEAGVDTIPECRGRGLAGLTTAAWAAAIQESGRTPIYSTSWSNLASLAVARKLELVTCASYWCVYAKDWRDGGDL